MNIRFSNKGKFLPPHRIPISNSANLNARGQNQPERDVRYQVQVFTLVCLNHHEAPVDSTLRQWRKGHNSPQCSRATAFWALPGTAWLGAGTGILGCAKAAFLARGARMDSGFRASHRVSLDLGRFDLNFSQLLHGQISLCVWTLNNPNLSEWACL